MKTFLGLTLLLAIAALALAIVAMQPRPPQPSVATSPVATAPQPSARTEALERQVSDLTTTIEQLKKSLSVADASAPDDEHIKEIVRAELRDQMARFGQGRGGWGGPQDPKAVQKELIDQVKVDDAKAEQLSKLVDENRAAVRELFRNGNAPDQAMTQAQELRKQLEAKGAEILTPEEAERFHTWLENRQQRWGRGPGQGQRDGQPPGGAAPAPKGASF